MDRRLPKCIPSLLLAMACGGALALEGNAAARPDDPLHSADCEAAMASLQAAERDAPKIGRGEAPPPALQAARRRVARVCLGSRLDPDRPPQAPQWVAPITVPPASGGRSLPDAAAAARLPPRPEPVAPLPPANRPPPTISGCDALGCWASDGTRLNNAGPNLLVGPRGTCFANGTSLVCP